MDKEVIICPACQKSFPRSLNYKHCSNCFACTGCEIYYCPFCDERIEFVLPKQPKIRKPGNN